MMFTFAFGTIGFQVLSVSILARHHISNEKNEIWKNIWSLFTEKKFQYI